ncbi:Putative gamma-glutamyltransferase YwrD [Wickerhamiella sorbophila]|uniref:Gamma-glutamyltransferase YwrD n=1 Tax=Wickerhamiella sorbophila TaxID=45607 RepID=A0A2T0FDS9_9ASCO|nr:Putative gamma-glutamyltransferase YwrD [Wickerhamiella sorbophila]PRT53117.1 Putative gamma-glutamyltransferase YwrD [Wickerhamiella sorbophila]
MTDYHFNSRRSVVHSTKGICAATQPVAAAAGVKILEQGGNAAMAAVAMAAAMGVAEPMMTGIGGDVFCLYYDAKTQSVSGFNGSGKSAKDIVADDLKDLNSKHLPATSPLSVNVPGAPAGWCDIVEKWGNDKLNLTQILQPAIDIARNGFGVAEICAQLWKDSEPKLQSSANGHELLVDGKRAPTEGELFVNENLAKVYEAVGKHGKKGYYDGPIADAIVEAVQSLGGKLSHEDLKIHESLILEPITMPIDDEVTLHELPPNNHGLVALLAMGIIHELAEEKKIDLKSMKHNSAEYIHLLTEALKFAFKDADHYIGDPHEIDFNVNDLLGKKFLQSRAKLFSASSVNKNYEHGVINPANSSDTSYFTVADSEGNACSIIASVYHGFGSGIVPKGCGFALHNRGCNFNLKPGTRNTLAGGKRPYHTIIPAMLTKGKELYAAYGVMGGFMQPQGHVQVALNMRLFGMNPQQALDAPRICLGPYPDKPEIPTTDEVLVNLEVGIDAKVVADLEAMGHKVRVLEGADRALFGRGQVIQQSKQNGKIVYHAGSDLRGDGAAIPQV